MSAVSWGEFKDQKALILENESIRVLLLPSWGAKTVSLWHKGLGIEALWQNPKPEFTRTEYGDSYDLGEFAGFDEMFPTVSRCFYEAEPWAGVEVPDHGEVWTVPWDVEVHNNEVTMSVSGTRFPYTLKKTISIDGTKLISRYTATNLSTFPLDYIWAVHSLFNASEGMRFIVPQGMSKAINAVPGPTLGAYGRQLEFPAAKGADDREVHLDRVPPRNDVGYQKYWFAEKMSEGWCMIRDDSRAFTIGIAFPKERVPYLGMWLNEGGWEGQYNIAPEPATAAMDRIDFSKMWGMGSVLPPKSSVDWYLIIALAEGNEPKAMNTRGNFEY